MCCSTFCVSSHARRCDLLTVSPGHTRTHSVCPHTHKKRDGSIKRVRVLWVISISMHMLGAAACVRDAINAPNVQRGTGVHVFSFNPKGGEERGEGVSPQTINRKDVSYPCACGSACRWANQVITPKAVCVRVCIMLRILCTIAVTPTQPHVRVLFKSIMPALFVWCL